MPELDFVASTLSDSELEPFTTDLNNMLADTAKKPKDVATFVLAKKEELES